MNKKMLVIPGGFVPYNDPVTLISYKHLRLLPLEMDVIALKGKEDITICEELKKDKNFEKFNIEYVCNYDDAVATFERKNIISGIYNIIRYINCCLKKAKSNDYEFMYSSSVPCFTHLAAYFVKRKYPDIKWVASFSDPLKKSPYKYDWESFKEYSLIAKIGFLVYVFIYMNGLYETIAMKYADKIIYICEEQEAFMIKNHPKIRDLNKKSLIVPLNYIPEWKMYSELINHKHVPAPDGKIKMGHFGRIYGLRKIDIFIEALDILNRKYEGKLHEKIEIVQYGQIIERYVDMIKDKHLDNVFFISEKIAYSDAVNIMKNCDALLMFDTLVDKDEFQPYIPSKTLEYILLEKPIVTLSCDKSPLHRLSKDFNILYSDNIDSMVKIIENLINKKYQDVHKDYSSFANENSVQKLKEYILMGI